MVSGVDLRVYLVNHKVNPDEQAELVVLYGDAASMLKLPTSLNAIVIQSCGSYASTGVNIRSHRKMAPKLCGAAYGAICPRSLA